MNPQTLKTCCVTGHRKIDPTKIESVKEALRCAIIEAIGQGYTHFISGFAEGVDLYFAAIVAELKEKHNLTLEAAIPYRNRINSSNAEFQRLLHHCNVVSVHSEVYGKGCFFLRNQLMVQASDLVIAVYDGRNSGGTLFTMGCAHMMDKEVKVISL